jgi:hypothetical protein
VKPTAILTAHNDDDLPMSVEVLCGRCRQACWIGPRQEEYRKANPGTFVIWCFRCLVKYGINELGPLPVAHLGNPLS